MSEQIEKAFQKQQGIFQNPKVLTKKTKNLRWYKDIGLGYKTPKEAIEGHYIDKKCPWTGEVSIRGRILSGVVVSAKMKRTIIVRREYLHYIPKYHRYEKRHKNLAAHLSPAFVGVESGDTVTVGQCRHQRDIKNEYQMIISKKNRRLIYECLFKGLSLIWDCDGVLVARKDFHAPKHQDIDVPNLEVIKACQSLTSRGYVETRFSWQYYYYTLTSEGIAYIREYLHLPSEIVPSTFKKVRPLPGHTRIYTGLPRTPEDYRYREEPKKEGFEGEFKPDFKGGFVRSRPDRDAFEGEFKPNFKGGFSLARPDREAVEQEGPEGSPSGIQDISATTTPEQNSKRKIEEVFSLFKELTEPGEVIDEEPKRKIMRVTQAQYKNISEEQNKVEVSYDPIDFKSYMKRLSTFDISFIIEFSLYTNVDVDKLQCVTCAAELEVNFPHVINKENARKEEEKLYKLLATAHAEHCSWGRNPCSDNIYRFRQLRQDHAVEEFRQRASELIKLGENLPVIKTDLSEEFTQTVIEALCLDYPLDLRIAATAGCLSLFGWEYQRVLNSFDIIRCKLCLRRCALINFRNISKQKTIDEKKQKDQTRDGDTIMQGQHQEQETTLKSTKQTPDLQEQTPNQQEQAPDQQEQIPDQQEQIPDQQEQIPDQQEQAPDQQEQTGIMMKDSSDAINISTDSDKDDEYFASINIEGLPKTPDERLFDVQTEHKYYCPWITGDGKPAKIQTVEQLVQKLPGWHLTMEAVVKSTCHKDDSKSETQIGNFRSILSPMKSNPFFEVSNE
ncbi:13149_t:CDS:10 [Ambispora gerdemannii]|uniref:Small ribosomal subunit protein uS17 n=1 Tax=Ambispora gerdemannii TaxID=144530 RepID=A0A9N9GDL1_9GLOM|nr:13149_t:CDS:10 [Ambispora gerdemannii]